jgi:hypothetical protein
MSLVGSLEMESEAKYRSMGVASVMEGIGAGLGGNSELGIIDSEAVELGLT